MNEKEKNIALLCKLEDDAKNIRNSEFISNKILTKDLKYVNKELLQKWQEEIQNFICKNYGVDSIFYETFLNHKNKNKLGTIHDIFNKQLITFTIIKDDYLSSEIKKKTLNKKYFNIKYIKDITNNSTFAAIISYFICK